jgi:hypothetical protein
MKVLVVSLLFVLSFCALSCEEDCTDDSCGYSPAWEGNKECCPDFKCVASYQGSQSGTCQEK